MKIEWRTEVDWPRGFGHGVEFYLGDSGDPSRLVAFLEGYEWLHGSPSAVVVIERPSEGGKGSARLNSAQRAVIERLVRRRMVFQGRQAEGLYAHFNA